MLFVLEQMSLQGSQGEWRNVFFMTGGIYLFGGFIYLILGSGNVEEWAKRPVKRNTDDSKKSEINPFDSSEEKMIGNGIHKEKVDVMQTRF